MLLSSELLIRLVRPPIIELRVKRNRMTRKVDKENIRPKTFDVNDFHYIPNSKAIINHNEFSYVATHDKYGWRNPCFKEKSNIDLFLVGDSFTWGTGVKDENTLSCAFKKKNIDVYTLGIPGAGAKKYYKIIKRNRNLMSKINNNEKPDLITMVFVGNDFESFLKYGEIDSNVDANNKIKGLKSKIKLIDKLNNLIVHKNTFNLGDSYLIAGIKTTLMRLRGPDIENAYTMTSGSTFYLKDNPPNVDKLVRSLKKYNSDIEKLYVNHRGMVLIPEPAEIDHERLKRDSKLRRISVKMIDKDYKYNNFINACNKIQLKCFDGRKALNDKKFFFVHDNHINSLGVKKLSEFIKTKFPIIKTNK